MNSKDNKKLHWFLFLVIAVLSLWYLIILILSNVSVDLFLLDFALSSFRLFLFINIVQSGIIATYVFSTNLKKRTIEIIGGILLGTLTIEVVLGFFFLLLHSH